MRKITIVISLTLLCAFAVVRRREQQAAEPFFEETITRVVQDDHLVYQVRSDQEVVGNKVPSLLQDFPTVAAQYLANEMGKGVWVTHGSKVSWFPLARYRHHLLSEPLPTFWDLN